MRWQEVATSIVFIVAASPPASGASVGGAIATPSAGVAGMSQSVSLVAPSVRNQTVTVTATQGALSASLAIPVNRTGAGKTLWAPPTSGTWLISANQRGIRSAQVIVSAMPTKTQVAVPTNTTQHYP